MQRLRARLGEVGYTVDGVQALLGPVAHAALHRNETVPGRRACRASPGPLATLIELFLLQVAVPIERVERALPGLVAALIADGLLDWIGDDIGAAVGAAVGEVDKRVDEDRTDAGWIRAAIDIRPYGSDDRDLWVVADLTPGMDGERPRVDGDHVLGVNAAATTLAQVTVRRPVDRALDLGTGCGVQALHLADHAGAVVGTDINPRALTLARATGALNGLELQLRAGDMFEPVAGERFGLIVSNPPFVISPSGELTYRESGLVGDELCRRFVQRAPRHLADGGVCQLLANWLHVDGEPWSDRLERWVGGSGCDAWVVQRELADPAEYIEVWLKDAGLHGAPSYADRYERWLDWFATQRVEGIGFGWILLRRTAGVPVIRIEEWTDAVRQPLGSTFERWLDLVDRTRGWSDNDLLGQRLRLAPQVHQEQIGEPGATDPAHIVLRQRAGFCRHRPVDTVTAGFVGACDGELTARQIIEALEQLLGSPASSPDSPDSPDAVGLADRLLPVVQELIHEGFVDLEPAAT